MDGGACFDLPDVSSRAVAGSIDVSTTPVRALSGQKVCVIFSIGALFISVISLFISVISLLESPVPL